MDTKFEGRPCTKCGGTLRYKKERNECVACVKERTKRYQQSPKGKIFMERYRKSPECKLVQKRYQKIYLQTPKGKAVHRVNTQRQKAKRRNAEGSHTTQEWLDLKEHFENCCLCCGRHESQFDEPLEQDHIVPLSKGGSNWISNIQPLCEDCNGMGGKGTKTIDYRDKYKMKRLLA
jgi:5-methylcytosine-specific restriction endonuclease McrA